MFVFWNFIFSSFIFQKRSLVKGPRFPLIFFHIYLLIHLVEQKKKLFDQKKSEKLSFFSFGFNLFSCSWINRKTPFSSYYSPGKLIKSSNNPHFRQGCYFIYFFPFSSCLMCLVWIRFGVFHFGFFNKIYLNYVPRVQINQEVTHPKCSLLSDVSWRLCARATY